jgi:RES domain-containing protein
VNAAGVTSVLYASLDAATACLELLDGTDEQEDDVHLYAKDLALDRVLDLRIPDVLAAFNADANVRILSLDDFVVNASPPTSGRALQIPTAVGLIAMMLDVHGIIVPSAAWERHAMDKPVIEWMNGAAWPLDSVWRLSPENPANLVLTREVSGSWNEARAGRARLAWPEAQLLDVRTGSG